MWTLYSDSGMVRVKGTKMPTFEIETIWHDENGKEVWVSRYFSQDESASNDIEVFEAMGFGFIAEMIFPQEEG
jgi:hypothetical protein